MSGIADKSVLIENENLPDIFSLFEMIFPEICSDGEVLATLLSNLSYDNGNITGQDWDIEETDYNDEFNLSFFYTELTEVLKQASIESGFDSFIVYDFIVLSKNYNTLLLKIKGTS